MIRVLDNEDFKISDDDVILELDGVIRVDECPYFKGNKAITHWIVNFSSKNIDAQLYDKYLSSGYRRTGNYLYKNICPHCKKCIPIRIKVDDFCHSKSHKKILKRNLNVKINKEKNKFTLEKYSLFSKYLLERHKVEDISYKEFEVCYCTSIVNTYDFVYRVLNKIVAVGILDISLNCISSVYFYYNFDYRKFSIGYFSMLKEIEYCLIENKKYYYLGYYLKDYAGMDYKVQLKPHQLYIDNEWIDGDLI